MQRTASESAASTTSSKMSWRLGSALRKIGSNRSDRRDDRSRPSIHDHDHSDPSLTHLRRVESSSINEAQESNLRQLQTLIARMRAAPAGPNHVDGAYKEFTKIKDSCHTLCLAILQDELRPLRAGSNDTDSLQRRDSSFDSPHSPGAAVFDQRSSFSGRSLTEVATGSVARVPQANELFLAAIRDWKNCLETLTEAFRVSLADTYKSYERDATQEMVDLLFSSKRFRKDAVNRMRNASVTRVLSADPQFFPRYEIRFRNYEKVKGELGEIRHILQSGESGILPSRTVEEYPIAPRGDAILEFANITPESNGSEPVLRFRVSSYMLAETSPIFARMFSGHSGSLYLHEAGDINDQLPPPPAQYIFKDGSEAKLYRMPQYEVNHLRAMETLMHAAHMHNEQVPREVSFEQFVAIAECCMRYKSTSPLELVVEHRWLPQWMHKGADDMPDGLLVISYAFGSRQLFTRMSKSAILNLVDEKDLQSKPWPQKIKDRVWAVRCAKVAQVYASCTSTIQEYLRPPTRTPEDDPEPLSQADLRLTINMPAAPPKHAASLTSTPRCPKGNHGCDAVNLGWMMLVYNEMDLLPQIMRPSVLGHLPQTETQPRSLAQMVDILRRMPSPASPIHQGGVCDPGPSFRTAIADIYNSVTGLTLHDVSGKSHGWALSKHRMSDPQVLVTSGLGRMAAPDDSHTVTAEFPDTVRLRILQALDDVDDLHAAALTNRGFYDTYQRHELSLIRRFLRADRIRRASERNTGHEEDKVPKEVSDRMKEEVVQTELDARTISEVFDEDDDGEAGSDNESLSDASTASAHDVLLHHQPGDPPKYDGNSSPPTRGRTSPTTPRQSPMDVRQPSRTSPTKQPDVITAAIEDDDVMRMTEEEARRILWPDSILDTEPPPRMSPPTTAILHPRAHRHALGLPNGDSSDGTPPPADGIVPLWEKFRHGDPSLDETLEDKTLVVTGEKQLRSEHDRRVGLLKKGGVNDHGNEEADAGGASKGA
ncbi:arthropod defensin domain-containing protein [Purpureocillium lavendulum]|uniref:Arthropod defensin domain-containing protein n=1 Tax=Purpureocillium lavendulum TaxID=1247861 RepID=A0AB34G5J2_9HYPO|nr:arthropod defensin domain-containing protein [Purpureocillium lavendulum]